jgi:hypothetical protein
MDDLTTFLLADLRARAALLVRSRGVNPLDWIPSIIALEIEALPLIREGVSQMPQQPQQPKGQQPTQAPQQQQFQHSPERQQQARALGLDLGNLDWSRVGEILAFLGSLLQSQPPTAQSP